MVEAYLPSPDFFCRQIHAPTPAGRHWYLPTGLENNAARGREWDLYGSPHRRCVTRCLIRMRSRLCREAVLDPEHAIGELMSGGPRNRSETNSPSYRPTIPVAR